MRDFAIVLLLGFAAGKQFVPKGGKTLEEVYGPMADVDEVVPWGERGARKALPHGYHSVRTADNCTFPIELYIIQDETGSFADNYEEMKGKQLKLMYDTISVEHPGSTFGVGTHRDIPIWSLGEPETDYCWKFRLPLQSNYDKLYGTYDELVSIGGGDAPEWQFASIIAACQSKTPGWSDPLAARLLVVATDAQPHFADDGFNKPEYHLTESSGMFDEANAKEQCLTEYYPSPTQVAAAIQRRSAYVGFLIFDGEYNQGGLPIDAWQWFNAYIGQSKDFVANVRAGATDFWTQLSAIITRLEDLECHPDTTTAPVTGEPEGTTEGDLTTADPRTTAAAEPVTTPTPATTTTTHVSTRDPTTILPTTATPTPTIPLTTVVEEGSPECPPCPEKGDCACPAVKIVLQDKPLHLRLEVDNEMVPV